MPNTDIPDHTVTLWLNLFHTRFMRISFVPISHPLFIHTTREFKVSLFWHFQVTNNTGIFVRECRKTIAHKIHFLKQNHGLTVLAQYVICRDENINHIEVSVRANCSICWGQLNVYVVIFGTTTNSGSYSLSVFWYPHPSDSASGFFICLRGRGSKLLYPVLDNVAVRNPSGSLC